MTSASAPRRRKSIAACATDSIGTATSACLLSGPAAADAALAKARTDPALAPLLAAPLRLMRLRPTARSGLHG